MMGIMNKWLPPLRTHSFSNMIPCDIERVTRQNLLHQIRDLKDVLYISSILGNEFSAIVIFAKSLSIVTSCDTIKFCYNFRIIIVSAKYEIEFS